MKQDTIDRDGATIKRQLDFPKGVYQAAERLMNAENDRLGLVGRGQKKAMKDILPELVEDGIKYRNGAIYTPADKQKEFSKNDKWVKLRAKAEIAIEDLRKYEEKLLSDGQD